MVHLINWMNGVRYTLVWCFWMNGYDLCSVPPLYPYFIDSGFLEGNDDFTHRCAEIIEYLIRAIINTSVVRILSFVYIRLLYTEQTPMLYIYTYVYMKWRSNKIKHKFLSFFYFLQQTICIVASKTIFRLLDSLFPPNWNLLSRTF